MIIQKMTPAFQKAEGGLFSAVEKADVGDGVLKMRERGIAIMSWADPFYPDPSIPSHVAEAMKKSIDSGFASHYTVPIGSSRLKKEIAKKLERKNGLKVCPDRNILITPGSDSGLFFVMLPFITYGDEVMIVDPSYPNNFQNVEIMGGTVVRIPVYAENGYQFDVNDFEKKLTSKTKMVILTNPNNPTTTVYRRDKLEALAKFIIKNDLVLVVDQAFEELIYDGHEMVTMASLPGMWERTLTVFSISKGMGLSGLRVGYVVADDHVMDKLYGTVVTVLGAANTTAQEGAVAAFRDDSFQNVYYDSFKRRRDIVYNALHDIPGVSMLIPESGFLFWLDISALGTVSEVVAYLNEKAQVSINAGTYYGEQGRGHIRIVIGVFNTEKQLVQVIQQIRKALLDLGKKKRIADSQQQYDNEGRDSI